MDPDRIRIEAERCCTEHGLGYRVHDVHAGAVAGVMVIIGQPDGMNASWEDVERLSEAIQAIPGVGRVLLDVASKG
jgi:hypothetical protein